MSNPPPMPFTPQQALEFMQKMWNPFGMPMPGGMPPAAPFPNPMTMFATLDPADIERKIGELRVIEGWLSMSLNFMQMSIKTMELQKASLEALRAGAAAASAPQSQPQAKKTKPKERE